MCLLCIEVAKQKMTPLEVARAYRETTFSEEHIGEILASIENNVEGGIDAVGTELRKLKEEA